MRTLFTVKRRERTRYDRRAFSLIELLVVITILLVLTAVTVASFNFSINADRMRAGARQLQSILVGARDKAIYAKEIRGVRLMLDPINTHTVGAVQYIGSPQREIGSLTFNSTITGDITGRNVVLKGPLWAGLARRGLLRAGTLIQIPRETGTWYTVSSVGSNAGGQTMLALNRPNPDLVSSDPNAIFVQFVLQLAPAALGDAQPIPLPRGVVIDLDGSQIPSAWFAPSASGSYAPQMDILFNPRGTVVGDATTLGMLHLHIADASDVLRWSTPAFGIAGRSSASYSRTIVPVVPVDNSASSVPVVLKNDHILLTVSARSGNISVHSVYPSPISTSNIAIDPFFYAETGQVAAK